MTSLRRHFLSHGFEIDIFCGITVDYQPAKLQCCRLFASSFTERLEKRNLDVIMTSFHILWDLKFVYFVNYWPSFKFLGYLDLILEVGIRHQKNQGRNDDVIS